MNMMKFVAIGLCVATGALAAPSRVATQDLQKITNAYSFDISLPDFIKHADAKDPSTLNWETDGCTASPDNPFGFNFLPACRRHDFGYHNFQAQKRFTESARHKIDKQFKKDLKHQCDSEEPKFVCDGLADVYYAAVRAFGDVIPGKRAEDLMAIYEEKLAIYNELVKQAQEKGLLPASPDQ